MKTTPALDARKGRILAAIIQEYIHSAEPVASEVVVRRSGAAATAPADPLPGGGGGAVDPGRGAGAGRGGALPLGDRHGPPTGAPLPPPALRAAGCAPRAGRDCHRCRSLRRPAGRTARVG